MAWLGNVLAQVFKSLIPWLIGIAANLVAKLVSWFVKRKEEERQKQILEENAKKLQEAIDQKLPRTERQKAEEDLLNS